MSNLWYDLRGIDSRCSWGKLLFLLKSLAIVLIKVSIGKNDYKLKQEDGVFIHHTSGAYTLASSW